MRGHIYQIILSWHVAVYHWQTTGNARGWSETLRRRSRQPLPGPRAQAQKISVYYTMTLALAVSDCESDGDGDLQRHCCATGLRQSCLMRALAVWHPTVPTPKATFQVSAASSEVRRLPLCRVCRLRVLSELEAIIIIISTMRCSASVPLSSGHWLSA